MKTNLKKGWHVLYVKSKYERKIENSLKQKDIEVFLPTIKTIRQWSDRKKVIEKPLFPSYIFVKVHSALDLNKILSIEGACSYIRFGNEYAIAREDEIRNIKYLINHNGILEDIEISDQLLSVGKRYKIHNGPLSGLECVIIRMENKDRIMIRVESLKQNIYATLPKFSFEKLKIAI